LSNKQQEQRKIVTGINGPTPVFYTHAREHTHTHLHTHTYTHTCTHAHPHTHIHTHTHLHTPTHTYTHLHTPTHTPTHLYTHTHTPTHTHTYLHTYTHTIDSGLLADMSKPQRSINLNRKLQNSKSELETDCQVFSSRLLTNAASSQRGCSKEYFEGCAIAFAR